MSQATMTSRTAPGGRGSCVHRQVPVGRSSVKPVTSGTPLTAHGITDAMRDAELLSQAIVRGNGAVLAGYQATRDRIVRGFFELTDRIASFQWTLEEVRELHLSLSREMNAQVSELLSNVDRPSKHTPVSRTA